MLPGWPRAQARGTPLISAERQEELLGSSRPGLHGDWHAS